MRKFNFKYVILLIVFFFFCFFRNTYSYFKLSKELSDAVILETVTLSCNLTSSSFSNNQILLSPNSKQTITLLVSSQNVKETMYKLYYEVLEGLTAEEKENVYIVCDSDISQDLTIGSINSGANKSVTVTLENRNDIPITITLGCESGLVGRELVLEQGDFIPIVKNFSYTGNMQSYTTLLSGTYQIELWGASGGDIASHRGGLGGYTSGYIELTSGQNLYFYVGGQGQNSSIGGWNGGSSLSYMEERFGSSGGGATDVRVVSGNWNDFASLKSRIMVSGGGGGANYRNATADTDLIYYGEGDGGAGGCLNGDENNCAGTTENYQATGNYQTYDWHAIGTGGSQLQAGAMKAYNSNNVLQSVKQVNGFGIFDVNDFIQSGAGSGWYSGGAGNHGGAGGGSSYISGHPGCLAVDQASTETSISHLATSEYSGFVFYDTVMIDGTGNKWTDVNTGLKEKMPINGVTDVSSGNRGNGYASITFYD